MGDDAA
jgi:hypothetical protein